MPAVIIYKLSIEKSVIYRDDKKIIDIHHCTMYYYNILAFGHQAIFNRFVNRSN